MPTSHEATKGTANKAADYHSVEAKTRADALSGENIAACIEVHRQLGPGLLESVYQTCLSYELTLRRIRHQTEVSFPVGYKGVELDLGLRVDLLVDEMVIVELKSVRHVDPVHRLQLHTYLRLSGRWLGLLVNFNCNRVAAGLHRVLNG